MLVMIVAAEAGALRGTHFPDRETLAIHLYAVGLLAGAPGFLSFGG
jgi:hypothetical protein